MAGSSQWRGNCRPEHYNLDYSRFNAFDAEETGGDFQTLLQQNHKNLPPEMKEAFRLSQLAKETGDPVAAKRAEELAKAAVLKGGPEIMERFTESWQEMSAKPELKAKFEASGRAVPSAAAMLGTEPQKSLKERLEQQRAQAEESLRRLEQEQNAMSSIQSPEAFVEFMSSKGWSETDLERAMQDPGAAKTMMEQEFKSMVGRSGAEDLDHSLDVLDEVTQELDALQLEKEQKGAELASAQQARTRAASRLRTEREAAARSPAERAAPAPRSPTAADTGPKPPEYSVVRGEAVLLAIRLPGVTSMQELDLEVAPGEVRLTDLHSPPRFGQLRVEVGAGAFERAKFSRKLAGLTLTFQP